jgi:hypothetical protein
MPSHRKHNLQTTDAPIHHSPGTRVSVFGLGVASTRTRVLDKPPPARGCDPN